MNTPIPFDDPVSPLEVAQHLKRMREIAGFTQSRAAERAGLSRETVNQWEHGQGLAKACKLLALFESYGCTVIFKPPKATTGDVEFEVP